MNRVLEEKENNVVFIAFGGQQLFRLNKKKWKKRVVTLSARDGKKRKWKDIIKQIPNEMRFCAYIHRVADFIKKDLQIYIFRYAKAPL